jgi:hypothetical protein
MIYVIDKINLTIAWTKHQLKTMYLCGLILTT